MRGTLLKLVAAALMVFAVSAQAQDGAFTLDHVNGQLAAGKLPTDNQLDFIIGINNNTGGNVDGITNGFRVYSPDGACWTSLTGDTLAWGDAFSLLFQIKYFSVSGCDADTVSFSGSRLTSAGLPADFNDTAYSITIGPISDADNGKTICLDSSYFPPSGTWKWAASGGVNYYPDWDGPHCFLIDACWDNPTPDTDNDTWADACDNCPNDYNPLQENGDNDSHGDACDNCPTDDNEDQLNSDNDTYGDVCDNCPTDDNEDQVDTDSDGAGDACDECPTTTTPIRATSMKMVSAMSVTVVVKACAVMSMANSVRLPISPTLCTSLTICSSEVRRHHASKKRMSMEA
jgi:hypothetical protein